MTDARPRPLDDTIDDAAGSVAATLELVAENIALGTGGIAAALAADEAGGPTIAGAVWGVATAIERLAAELEAITERTKETT